MADYVQRGNPVTTEKEYDSDGKISKLTLKLSDGAGIPDSNGCGIRLPDVFSGKGYSGETYPFEYIYYLYSCDVDDFTKDCALSGEFPNQYVNIQLDYDIDKYEEGLLKNWTKGRGMPSFMMHTKPQVVSLLTSLGNEDVDGDGNNDNTQSAQAFGGTQFYSEAITDSKWSGNNPESVTDYSVNGFTSKNGTTCIIANNSLDTYNYTIKGASQNVIPKGSSNRFAVFEYNNSLYFYGISVNFSALYANEKYVYAVPNVAGVFLEDKAGNLITLANGSTSINTSGYNSLEIAFNTSVTQSLLDNLVAPTTDSLGVWYGQLPIISLNVSNNSNSKILPQSVAALFNGKGINDGTVITDPDNPDPDTPDDDTNGGDPDDPGDGSDTDDGNTDSTPIVPPDITGTGTGAGFCLHKVTAEQLQSVIQKIFSTGDGSFVSAVKTFFGLGDNPFHYTPTELMQLILSCHCIPIGSPTGGSSTEIWCGFYDTGIKDTKRIDLWQNFTYGTVTVTKPTGTFIDTAGYRRIYIHVPFCGIFELDPSEVYGKTLQLQGRMNALTGQMIVTLSVSGKILYTYTGCACIPIPLTAEDCSGTQRALLSAGVSVVAGVATGAVGGAIAGAGIAASGAASGATAASVSGATVTNQFSTASGMASTIGNGLNSMVQNSTQAPSVAHSGGLGGGASAMDLQQAYLIIENREYVSRGDTYRKTLGLPSGKACKLSQLGSGAYAECSAVNLGLSGATSEEVNLAKKLLIQGVIV